MIREFGPADMNNLIMCAKEHVKEMGITANLKFDDVHFVKNFKEYIMRPTTIAFVYTVNDNIVGYAIGRLGTKIWNPTLYANLDHFYVHKAERNKIVADQLWYEFERTAREKGCAFIESSVLAHGENWQGIDEVIDRASTYFEHKHGDHCGNVFVHKLETA